MRAECSDQVMVGGSVQAGIVSLHHHARPARAGWLSQHASTGHPLQPSRVRPFLGPPGAREGSNGGWRDPERIDDPTVLEPPLGAGSAKQVLGDVEASCRLCGSEQAVLGTFIENSRPTAADHRLTKILVLA